MIGRGNTNIVQRIAVVNPKPGARQAAPVPHSEPGPLPPTKVPPSTAGHSVAATTRYLGPVLRGRKTQRAAVPTKYLFDGPHTHPGQAVVQAHPASGFVYPWVPNPVKRGGGVPQGKTFSTTHKVNPLTKPFLPPPKLEILTPPQSGGGTPTGPGGGGGGIGGGGGGGGIGGGGGHLK